MRDFNLFPLLGNLLFDLRDQDSFELKMHLPLTCVGRKAQGNRSN